MNAGHAAYLDSCTFKLVDRKVVQCRNDDEWFAWFQQVEANRRVAKTEMGDVSVSTVFVGLVLTPDRMPFETKVFGGKHNQEEYRTATWEEAEAKHAEIVSMIMADEMLG
jgi:hypothetical protein